MNRRLDYGVLAPEVAAEMEAFDLKLLVETLQETAKAQGFAVEQHDYLMLLEVVGTALEQANWDAVRDTLNRRAAVDIQP